MPADAGRRAGTPAPLRAGDTECVTINEFMLRTGIGHHLPAGAPPEQPRSLRDVAVPRWLIPATGLAMLALTALAWRCDPPLYFSVLTALMLHPYSQPFIDGQQIPAVIDCWQQGVDVYVDGSCDPLQRPFAYSPLWLRAGFLNVPWTPWIGLGIDGAICLGLALLPLPRRGIDALLFVLTMVSGMPVFALERLNIDAAIFLMILVAGWFWTRSSALRFAGYAGMALAGFLKFYPLTLFLLFLRERLAIFAGLCAAALVLLAGFVWRFGGELSESMRNLPSARVFSEGFAATQLPVGLEMALNGLAGLPDSGTASIGHNPLIALAALALLVVAALAIALWLAARAGFAAALDAITLPERGFLVIGAILLCACFFAASNNNYRGIHFLLVMPGLLALWRVADTARAGRLFGGTVAATLFVTWGMSLQQLVAAVAGGSAAPIGGAPALYLYWILHELAWWWVIAVLLAVVFRFILQSPVWAVLRLPPRRLGSAPAG